MSEEQIILLRKWIQAEVDYAIAWHEEVNHGGSAHDASRHLDNIFKQVLESGLATKS